MRREWDEDEIRSAFAEWRAEDERASPEFDATVAAGRDAKRRQAAPVLPRRIAAAAALLVVASGAIWATWRQHQVAMESTVMAAASSLSLWRSPTAFLLEVPAANDVLVKTTPVIAPALPDLNLLDAKDPLGGRS